MTFTTHQSSIRTVRSTDPMFRLNDGMVVGQRAGFEIAQTCPKEYRAIIQSCLQHGWLKPVAYMHDYEQTFAILKNE